MPYLHPIEGTSNMLSSVNIAPGNIIFDITREVLQYDTVTGNRIDFTEIRFFNTEVERDQSDTAINGKLYIVLETGYIYLRLDYKWIPLKIKPGESYILFYIAVGGTDNNAGISAALPAATIKKILTTYSANTEYIIGLANDGIYSEAMSFSNKTAITLFNSSATDRSVITSSMTFSGISNISISNLDISGVTFTNCNALLKNCIIRTNSLIADNSRIILEDCIMAEMGNKAIDATNGATVVCKNTTGSSIPIAYAVSNGAVINVIGDTLPANTLTDITGTGRVYFEGESVDKSTKEYIESLLTIKEV